MIYFLQYYNKKNENEKAKKNISILINQYLLSIKTKFANNFLTNDKQACNY